MKWGAWFLALAAPVMAGQISVPSGQPVSFVDVIKDVPGSDGATWRFRFVAPQITRDQPGTAADIDALCNDFVLAQLVGTDPLPEEIVVSVADRLVEFGVANPDAIQFFEAYEINEQRCIWKGL